MKRWTGWVPALLLLLLLLPGMAWGEAEQTAAEAKETATPGFEYYSLGTEAAKHVRLREDGAWAVGGLHVLRNGYLSKAHEGDGSGGDAMGPLRAENGPPVAITCLDPFLRVRWVLEDERLEGVMYPQLQELDDALLLGTERGLRGAEGYGYAPSMMLLDKATGEIRWQVDGGPNGTISDFWEDGEGRIYLTSYGDVWKKGYNQAEEGQGGRLYMLRGEDGSLVWQVDYQAEYGVALLLDICPLGDDGLLLYGRRENDHIVLYVNRRGSVQGWFAFQPWRVGNRTDTYLRLYPDGDAAYLAGWEVARVPDSEEGEAARTLCMMRIDQSVFMEETAKNACCPCAQ